MATHSSTLAWEIPRTEGLVGYSQWGHKQLNTTQQLIRQQHYIIYYIIKYVQVHAKSFQSCPTLCDLVDCIPPGSSVHGILQARILEWVAMPSSRGSSQPRGQTCVSCFSCIGRQVLYHQRHLGSPIIKYILYIIYTTYIK